MVKKELRITELPDSLWRNTESVGCVVKVAGSSVLLCCMYRPPSASKRYNKNVRKVIKKSR